jgi:hypothetical protein
MSFFGFDLLTDMSMGFYVSGDFDSYERNGPVDNDDQEEQSRNQEAAVSRSRASASVSNDGSNGSYGYFTHATTTNTVQTPPAVPVTIELRRPPVATSTASDELEAEDAASILTSDELQSMTGGIIILSSVPSQDMDENVNDFYSTAPPPVHSLEILAVSPQSAGFFSNSHHQNQHALSISTTESVYQLQHHQQHNMSLSSSTSSSSSGLSLNPSSLASSAMTSNMALSFSDNSSYNSYSTSRPFSAAVLSAAVSGRQVGGLDKYCRGATDSMYHAQPTMALIPAAGPNTSTSSPSILTQQQQQQQQQPWYARFTEADWERMQECTLQILTALGSEDDERTSIMCPDMFAALLIQQEEELFWNENNHKRSSNSWQQSLALPSIWSTIRLGNMVTTSACWRILATAATLSLGATATLLISGSRRREEQNTSNRDVT